MQIQIRANAFDLTRPVRRAIDRRVRLSLGPLAAQIALAECTLKRDESTNGPIRAVPGVECWIEVTCRDGTRIRTEAREADIDGATEVAAWRLQHRLRLRLRRDTGRARRVG